MPCTSYFTALSIAECPDPPELPNGSFSLSEAQTNGTSARGVIATYACSVGFGLDGEGTLTCQLGNIWSPSAPGICQGNIHSATCFEYYTVIV